MIISNPEKTQRSDHDPEVPRLDFLATVWFNLSRETSVSCEAVSREEARLKIEHELPCKLSWSVVRLFNETTTILV